MHEVTLLINIAVALVVAFFGGLIARYIGLPTIVGYLLAGIVIGPFTPGFVGDTETISQLAELGVIFLMFGVGLHFSLKDLWKVRSIALPGALGRMAITILLGFGLSQLWGWPTTAGIVIGLAISIASTVVLLRGLTDNGLLNTQHGQAAVGWVIVEDLATVLILVLMPTLANTSDGFDWQQLGLTLLKAAGFVILVLFAGTRLIPWVLLRIAHTRSRELFILVILAIALGIALGAAELFGVSLALGTFVAGVVVNESPLSHQVGADVLPFREAFAVLFFVSIGMLVNPIYLLNNIGIILALTGLIVIGKALVTMLMGVVFPWPARTTLVLAAGLSQIGEFSFILGQEGMALGLLEQNQYSLILAGALLSITLNAPMFRLIHPVEKWLQRFPKIWTLLNRQGSPPIQIEELIKNHVVIVGYGRVGRHIVSLLGQMAIPCLVVEADAERVEALDRRGVPSLFGDAANSEVLTHAGLERARALVVAGPDEDASALVVTAAHDLAPELPIIVRATTEEGTKRLMQLGAQEVIHPELEGGLEIVRHTLLRLGFPLQEIYRYTDAVRRDHYDLQINTEEEHRLLHSLLNATNNIEVKWFHLPPGNPLAGKTLADANLRAQTGASVVAILRENQLTANPKSMTVFQNGDRIGLIGDMDEIAAVEKILSPKETAHAPEEMLDLIDEDDAVIGRETRVAVHAKGLWHRGAHVFLFTREGKLLIQKRSAARAAYPSLWDGSVSEHVQAGETYLEAALRGTQEELGLSGLNLEPVLTFRLHYGPGDNKISTLFQSVVDPAEIRFDPDEIQAVAFQSLEELTTMMTNQPQEFCGWFVEIIRWYVGRPSNLVILKENTRTRPAGKSKRSTSPD